MTLTALALALLLAHLASVFVVARRLHRPAPPRPPVAPRVTLLRPVCGLDRFDAETLGSSFLLDYPDYEVIFCAARADDPVVPVIADLIARHPDTQARLLIGEDRITANPKLNNVQKGWLAATGDWVAMADANLLLPPDYLWQLVAEAQEGVALVTSPPLGLRAEGAWATLESAFLNGNQARLQLLADEVGKGFAQGKTLFWDRDFLEAQGGLHPLGRFLAEDVAATHLVRAAGRKIKLTTRPFAQPIGPRDLRAVWDRQLRWSKVRRDGFPVLFVLEPLNGGLLAMLLAGLAWGPPGVLALAWKWYGAELYLCWRAGWPVGRWTLPMMILRDLMMPALWVVTFGKRGFEWRGNSMAPTGLGAAE
ncbi:MAG: ceramide glucosyltransferase [Rhodobacteraceae bacterium PARR1]|nr:MAG: ceramide glucosyltransferase [Rhodobacteraceae bacterium PARR1]